MPRSLRGSGEPVVQESEGTGRTSGGASASAGCHCQTESRTASARSCVIGKGVEGFGFRGQGWTTERVAQMIKQESGVSAHPADWSRLLRQRNESQQTPTQKAPHRDEVAIQAGKEPQWTERKQRPKTKSARCVFGDELASFFLMPGQPCERRLQDWPGREKK